MSSTSGGSTYSTDHTDQSSIEYQFAINSNLQFDIKPELFLANEHGQLLMPPTNQHAPPTYVQYTQHMQQQQQHQQQYTGPTTMLSPDQTIMTMVPTVMYEQQPMSSHLPQKCVEQSAADSTSLVRYESANDTPQSSGHIQHSFDDCGASDSLHHLSNTRLTNEHRPTSVDIQSALTPATNVTNVESAGSTRAFVACKVCGDKASGYHYGVTSCEGCKGFFRRSIQKQIEYRCLRDGKCMVFRLNRNRCQYCRFKKCLAVGMSRDSVRYGRVPKRQRDDDARISSNTADGETEANVEARQLAYYDIILSVSQAHHCNCPYTDDKLKDLELRPIHFDLPAEPSSTDDIRGSMWETMSSFLTPDIKRVVEFAKRIPSFSELAQADQLALIKSSFIQVWIIRIARMFNAQHMTLTFADGSFITRDQLQCVLSQEAVSNMFSFAVGFTNLQLNDGEIALFASVVIMSGDRKSVGDPHRIDALQEDIMQALKLQFSRSRPSDGQIVGNLMIKLNELKQLRLRFEHVLDWYRQNYHVNNLPQLFSEIFDLTRSVEEQQATIPTNVEPPHKQDQSHHYGMLPADLNTDYGTISQPYGGQ